jgi:hypothetical protein
MIAKRVPRTTNPRHQWHSVAVAHRRAVARRAGEVRQLELDLSALSTMERQRCLGERGHRSRGSDGGERTLQHR